MRGRIPKDRGNLAMERVSKDYALCLTAVWSKLLSQTGRSAFGWALGFGIARWAYRCVAQPLRLRRGDISGDGNKRYAEHTASTGTHSEQHCSHSADHLLHAEPLPPHAKSSHFGVRFGRRPTLVVAQK